MHSQYERPIARDRDEADTYPSIFAYGCGCWILIFVVYSLILWML